MLPQGQPDTRSLAVLARDLELQYPELVETARDLGWRLCVELDAIQFEVGPHDPLDGIASAARFFASLLDRPRFEALRAAWVQVDTPLKHQLDRLASAEPFSTLVATDSSPILDILTNRRLETWFQPVFRARSLELWGHECLIRARSHAGELIGADKLLNWAHQENLGAMLDRVCRETHLASAGEHLAAQSSYVLLNFQPNSIVDPARCLQSTVEAAKQSQIAPWRIVFEVIESDRIDDRHHLGKILSFLREQGYQVALDDVGSGYAGLAMLGDLDPNLIKIDRYLVVMATENALYQGICKSLIGLGHDNGKLVLAEGVETLEQHELMCSLGVDLVQGFLFGRPNPLPYNDHSLAETG